MKVILMIAAIVSLMGAICETKKGWWVVLFAASVVLYMALGVVGGAA